MTSSLLVRIPGTLAFAAAFALPLTLTINAYADPVTFFNTIPNGRTFFDTQVSDANGTLYTDALSGLVSGANSWTRSDYVITSTDGNNRSVTTNKLNPAPTGLPGGDAINMTANGLTSSGLTFTFGNPINGFGIELDDWATCCYPSSLYISFDGGAPILIGTANVNTDNPGTAAGHGAKTFIGTIDDSGTFTVITFYGTGSGDVLNAGGIIRYAIVPIGAISGGGSGYKVVATNTPAKGYADYFDTVDDNGGPRQDVATYLNTAPEAEVVQAFKTIFPVNTGVTAQSMLSSSGQTSTTLIEKVGTILGSLAPASGLGFSENAPAAGFAQIQDPAGLSSDDPVAYLSSMPYQKFKVDEHAVWLEGVAAGADGRSTSTTLGYDTFSRGVIGGYEISLDEDHMVGVLAGVFHSDTDLDDDAGRTKAANYNVGVYGQKLLGTLKLTGIATVGYGDYDSQRHIDVGGVTATPESDSSAYSGSISIGASRLYEHEGFQIEPFGMLSYTAVKTDGYTEENGGAFNMEVSGDRFSTASARAGITIQHTTQVNERDLTFKVKPYIARQWEIEDAGNTTRFVGTASATTVNGRDLTVIETGLGAEAKYDLSDSTSLKFGADLSKDRYEQRYVSFIGVGVKF